MKVLVLITGTGRSGTSTMSGTLHHLGLAVPGPYLGANRSNPKGFFESQWAVQFHKRLTAAAHINDFDGRPGALDRVREQIGPDQRTELAAFLAEQADGHDQVVIKDPRTVWAHPLWRDAAADAGLEVRYISMLRHPAEVIGSRTTYYASKTDEQKRHDYEIFNVGRWINNSVISERETRGHPRAFVRYTDLLEDWRGTVRRLAGELDLHYDAEPTEGVHSPVDDFIDPGLRRHQVTWDELTIPAELQDIAEHVWQDVSALGDNAGMDEAASADLDRQGERYLQLFTDATAISHDALEEARDRAQRKGAKQARKELRAEAGAADRRTGAVRDVTDLSGRELLGEAARRASGRLPGRRGRR